MDNCLSLFFLEPGAFRTSSFAKIYRPVTFLLYDFLNDVDIHTTNFRIQK